MRNKRWIVWLLVLCLVFGTGFFVPLATAENDPFADLWDRIDGSTATIPLVQAMRLHFQGQEAKAEHSTTARAYERLCAYQVDLIFVTPPSPEDLAIAEQAGVELEVIPVTREALVFLNNVLNPVESLAVQELRDIYTGRVTSWSEVGGEDATIRAFQRQPRSGSQTLFLACLMGDEAPMEPEKELVDTMSGLIEQVSAYNSAPNALGYTVFYYATQMYMSENIRVLAVDGVMPSVQTISDGTYPLCTNYYAVLRKDTPTDALAREFVAWLLSEEGQGVAAAAGYVPLAGAAPGETEANEEQWARTHMSSGTGGTEARLYAFYHPYDDEEDIPQIPDDVLAMADAWWAQACMELYFEDYEDDYDMAAHTMIPSMWLVGDEDFEYHDYDENIDVNTALLSMWIAGDLDEDGQEDNFPLRTVVFDIEQKRVLALSDLFFDGVNYIDYINRHTVFAPNQNDSFPGFPNDHPYFIFTEEGDIRLFYADTIPFWQLDWTTFWTPSAFVPLNHWISPWGRCMVDVGFQYRLLPGGLSFPVPSLRVDDGHVPQAEAKINAALADIAERHIAEMDSWAQNVTWVRVGAYTTEHYVRVNFYFRNTDRQTITLSLNMFNLHTGQYFDTGLIFEQWKDSPQAVFIAHERGDESFQTLPGYRLPEGLRPERVSIVSNETGEITLDYYFSATPEGRLWMKVPLFLIEEALAGQ